MPDCCSGFKMKDSAADISVPQIVKSLVLCLVIKKMKSEGCFVDS